jgi:hypothetical protein
LVGNGKRHGQSKCSGDHLGCFHLSLQKLKG